MLREFLIYQLAQTSVHNHLIGLVALMPSSSDKTGICSVGAKLKKLGISVRPNDTLKPFIIPQPIPEAMPE